MLAILEGVGANDVHPLKKKKGGGDEKFYPILRGAHKQIRTHDFPILQPLLPFNQ